MEKSKNKSQNIEAERKRIFKALQEGTLYWCSECAEMHEMKVIDKELDHCLEDQCGHMIVLPWNEVFKDE